MPHSPGGQGLWVLQDPGVTEGLPRPRRRYSNEAQLR